MNTVNYSIFPPPPGGPPQPGHRPKRRRKNRDQRKKDQEKKKEKDLKDKVITLRKALLYTSIYSIPLATLTIFTLYGLMKFAIKIMELTLYVAHQVIQ